MVAITAVATVPANANALPIFPWLHPFAHAINDTNYLVSRHARILDTRRESFFDYRVAVVNATHASTLIRTHRGCGSGICVRLSQTGPQLAGFGQHAFFCS
jgi:hypothetical protein